MTKPNKRTIATNKYTVLVSYQTPVAVKLHDTVLITDIWYSKTTSTHINQFTLGYYRETIPQSVINEYYRESIK
ncbi:MAG: hypothetical protein KDH96_04350 [Candidatus Riesia sp.]|nr:hypothetical protein [Candidatus Riesia sp.]